jgi:single-strand DNA-binding protein
MAILTGLMRLGRDAEVKKVGNDSVANLALAYELSRKGDDGKKPTVWVDGALWGKRAEALAQYLTKGTAVVVTLNDPHVRTYPKKDGTQGFALTGQVIDITFAGGPAKASDKPAEKPKPAPAPVNNGGFDDPDDSIPF